jgi:hypothetical protein
MRLKSSAADIGCSLSGAKAPFLPGRFGTTEVVRCYKASDSLLASKSFPITSGFSKDAALQDDNYDEWCEAQLAAPQVP